VASGIEMCGSVPIVTQFISCTLQSRCVTLTGILASGGNVVTGNVTALSGIANDSRFLQISAPVQPGRRTPPMSKLFLAFAIMISLVAGGAMVTVPSQPAAACSTSNC
jgi:hypothetical protein